jgi:hypothetical protein
MARQSSEVEQAVREPGALIVALIIGLAGGVTLLAAYHQLVEAPELERTSRMNQSVNAKELIERDQSEKYRIVRPRDCTPKDEETCARDALPSASAISLSK